MTTWSRSHLEGFRNAAQSLKLYRRAELLDDEGKPLVGRLYVDPLPENHVYRTLLKPHTTFLIGRRGTGKSTIFERARQELKGNRACITAYINIKGVYEGSRIDASSRKEKEGGPSPETMARLLLYRSFLHSLVDEIKLNLDERLKTSLFAQMRERVKGSVAEVNYALDALVEYTNSEGYLLPSRNASNEEDTEANSLDRKASEKEKDRKRKRKGEVLPAGLALFLRELSDRNFTLEEVLAYIKEILSELSISYLYLFVDDLSELQEEEMQLVVDTLLAPLNNWSEELIKLKIAAYPNRIYYGHIDQTKIDEIRLDPSRAFGTWDVSSIEEKGTEFVRHLVEKRIEYFCGVDPSFFFEIIKDDIWRVLYHASMGNPRILGYILCFAYESRLIYDGKIGTRAIREAALRYYEEKIEASFASNRFLHESFQEHSSLFSLKQLLEQIITKCRKLASDPEMLPVKGIKGKPPTSHFHILAGYEPILSTLELNYFITRCADVVNTSGEKSAIYCLNYGLCQKYGIEFGRPVGKKEFRSYYTHRVFDYSSMLSEYLRVNQEIVCDECGEKIGLEKLEALRLYDMLCPRCSNGTCRVVNLSRRYANLIDTLQPDLLLPQSQIGMFQRLKTGFVLATEEETPQLQKFERLWPDRKMPEQEKPEQPCRVVPIRPEPDLFQYSRCFEDVRFDS